MVIAGDLFETHRPGDALVRSVLEQLLRLREAGVHVITTPGNHDEITYANSVYHAYADGWPGMLVMNPTTEHVGSLTVGGERVHVYSLAYTGGITPAHAPIGDFPKQEEPGFHLAVFHGTLGTGDARSLPLDRGALGSAGYDYVALGHIHLPSETTLGRTPVVYSGCQEGKGFDDPGVPHWTVVEVAGERVKVTREPLAVQPITVHELDLTPLDTVAEVEEAILALACSDTLMRVRLTGSLHFLLDAENLEGRFQRAFYHLEVRDESDAISEELLRTWAAERTIRGVFVKRMWDELKRSGTEAERQRVTRALRYGVRALRAQA